MSGHSGQMSNLMMSSDMKAKSSLQVDVRASLTTRYMVWWEKCGLVPTDLGLDRPLFKSQICSLLVSLSLHL